MKRIRTVWLYIFIYFVFLTFGLVYIFIFKDKDQDTTSGQSVLGLETAVPYEPDFMACDSEYSEIGKIGRDIICRWYLNDTCPPSKEYPINIPSESRLVIRGWVKEGHPEDGCPGGRRCDQGQDHEDFDLLINSTKIGKYRDLGAGVNAWTQIGDWYYDNESSIEAFTMKTQHSMLGDGVQSVDYKLTLCVAPIAELSIPTISVTDDPGNTPTITSSTEMTPTPTDSTMITSTGLIIPSLTPIVSATPTPTKGQIFNNQITGNPTPSPTDISVVGSIIIPSGSPASIVSNTGIPSDSDPYDGGNTGIGSVYSSSISITPPTSSSSVSSINVLPSAGFVNEKVILLTLLSGISLCVIAAILYFRARKIIN